MFEARKLWVLYVLGGLVMLLSLTFHPVGEEAIYPISTLEMWQQNVWLIQLLYGGNVLHNPLLNWLMVPVAQLLGWTQVLVAARIVTIIATLATGVVLAWLVWHLSRERVLAALSALSFLSFFDVLCYHGWLGYADPTFGLFIFSAVATLWVATQENRRWLLLVSVIAINLGFLAKAQTAYVFYATALFVLLFQRDARAFLLHPLSVVLLLIAFSFPFAWYALLPSGHAQGGRMAGEILAKLAGIGLFDYLRKLVAYPLEVLLGLFPVAWLAAWLLFRQRTQLLRSAPAWLHTAGWMALLMLLPYWLAPQSGIRYLIPAYPIFALFAAGIVWQAGPDWLERSRRWILFVLGLQALLFAVLFPYYQDHYRGKNYLDTAQDVLQLTQGHALYSNDSTASGLNVVMYLDVLRYPQQAVQFPPAQWTDGYALARTTDATLGQVVKTYRLGADDVVLHCRGGACPSKSD